MQPFPTVTWPVAGWRSVACEGLARIAGVDMTGWSFFAEVRDRPDGGAVRVTLNTVTTAVEGIRLIGVEMVDGVPVSTLAFLIAETTMEGLPASPEPGTALGLDWGMHMTPGGGGLKFMGFNGPFVVQPGVPQ